MTGHDIDLRKSHPPPAENLFAVPIQRDLER
jgi:hypothetical protein